MAVQCLQPMHSSLRLNPSPTQFSGEFALQRFELSNGFNFSTKIRAQMKKDDKLRYKMERIPFLEEQVRNIRETGKVMSMDIHRLLLSEENRFDFVNEVAAEATAYVENNRDEYGSKKPILHVLSNRMNEAGFHRSEAYIEADPYKPGPGYLRVHLYDQ